MRSRLLEVLRCPIRHEEQRHLKLCINVRHEEEILNGRLLCHGCGRIWPVEEGIPQMVAYPDEVESVQRGFDFQWMFRLRGAYESPGVSFGVDTRDYAGWLLEHCAPQLGGVGNWLLDAGCGSADKAAAVARLRPGDEVVGMDISGTLPEALRRQRQPNLHLVRADIRHPPFEQAKFTLVFSVGVLHHCIPGSTRDGFQELSRLTAKGGTLMVWLYPLPEEDDFWAAMYRQRDIFFLGVGNRLPKAILLALCHFYAPLTGPLWLPLELWFSDGGIARAKKHFPLVPGKRLSLFQMYKSYVFICFDNLHPEYQRRHGRDEVTRWYWELGFERVETKFPGSFCGWRPA